MSLCKPFSAKFPAVLFAFAAMPVSANMRAPIHIERASSELRAMPANLRVLNEVLEFRCPKAYIGKPDFKALAERFCTVRVLYRVSAGTAAQVNLVFVFAGNGAVVWKHGGKSFRSTPSALQLPEKKACTYCPDDVKRVNSAEQKIELTAGINEIEVNYDQALSYDESGHSYFSDGSWWQGFSYELWPIAEWQWAPDFSAELTFSVAARSGFLGIGYADDSLKCRIAENGDHTDLLLNVGKVSGGRRTARARISLKKRPQRLFCSYAAD